MPDEEIIETVEPKTQTQVITKTQVDGKVWTDEYVKTLREEAKESRLAKKALENTLRKLIGLNDGDELNAEKITQYEGSQAQRITEAITKANDRLVMAEIRAQQGYNTKLAEKLIDKSLIKIDDDGNVTGVVEALTALAVEYPEIVKKGNTPPSANPPNVDTPPTDIDKLTLQHAEAIKNGRLGEAIALKNQLFTLQNKG
jgi:hypothetical protein